VITLKSADDFLQRQCVSFLTEFSERHALKDMITAKDVRELKAFVLSVTLELQKLEKMHEEEADKENGFEEIL
jgi:hypothetical protein